MITCNEIAAFRENTAEGGDSFILHVIYGPNLIIQQAVLLLTIACASVGQTTYLHGVIDDNKAAFNLHELRLRQIEQGLFYVGNRGLLCFLVLKYRRLSGGNILLQ